MEWMTETEKNRKKKIYYEKLSPKVLKIEDAELIIYNSLYYEKRPQ
jgi:hypothetical protein